MTTQAASGPRGARTASDSAQDKANADARMEIAVGGRIRAIPSTAAIASKRLRQIFCLAVDHYRAAGVTAWLDRRSQGVHRVLWLVGSSGR